MKSLNAVQLWILKKVVIGICKFLMWWESMWFHYYLRTDTNYFATVRRIKANGWCPATVLTAYEQYSLEQARR